jgi:hypothetical protein
MREDAHDRLDPLVQPVQEFLHFCELGRSASGAGGGSANRFGIFTGEVAPASKSALMRHDDPVVLVTFDNLTERLWIDER